jgi:predicted pyridoxine 5'-phosphate oxidase superfamily flavin-nucleotide-binding protein
MTIMYHDGNRRLQDRFASRRLADRLEEKLTRTAFTEDDKAFIEGCPYFFLATADADGRPDCSFKGGLPGFVRVTGPSELAFPDYDGNGMFKSLGNITVNANVGLLCEMVGAQLIVRVKARAIFPNCRRYIPNMQMTGPSIYTPQPQCEPPEPAWKGFDSFKDVTPPRAPTWKG